MSVLMMLNTQLVALSIMLADAIDAVLPQEIKTRCDWANQMKEPINQVVGNFKGLALLVASVAGVVLLGALVFLAFSKHSKTAMVMLAIIVVAAGLLGAGVTLTPDSPC